ncbi:hypothetical protein Vretimale_766 [Volvox reticuliferus]|uniref:Uncharacterized protein n=1 Tax=Volvox reticuliferus TaxID=1737510 RepID=A0A8J4C049_9CHLO|nr:hypothetical protein Vretifemale_2267 [Volvox reticuliferus]GIL94532.1 hypothetical protein Vretimale_766 [Volvox reticuliferus]
MFSWLTGKTAKSPELKEAESVFTETELKLIQNKFSEEVSRQNGTTLGRSVRANGSGALDVHGFGALLGPVWKCLDPLIASHLQLQLADKADGKVHLSGLIIAKARAERLGEQASLEFSYRLLSADGKGVGYKALEAAALSCLRLLGAVPLCDSPFNPQAIGAVAVAQPGTATTSSRTSNISGSSTTPPDQIRSRNDKGTYGNSGGDGSCSTNTNSSSSSSTTHLQFHIAAFCLGALLHVVDASRPEQAASPVEDLRLSYDCYCKWTKRCPALHKALCSLLRRVGGPPADATAAAAATACQSAAAASVAVLPEAAAAGTDPLRLPALLQLGKLHPCATLLQPVWTWALASRLPPAQRVEWRLVFSSQRDGKSFNTFFSRISAAAGPTLLLLRDKAGGLFGGYASQPWTKSGTYFGDVSSFIFSLLPALQVFPATGINENFQWCGVGFSQLPGGIGFGGASAARGHFALYVDSSLDSGMSRPIATYGNTPLASEQVFQIDALECWLLQPPEEDPCAPSVSGARKPGCCGSSGSGTGSAGKGSILGMAVEDRAIMELAGLRLHSAGLKDEPLEED